MKLNKSTRYALYAAMELAGSDPDEQVTAAGVAERYGISTAVVAKVFPQLARSGIAVGLRGSGGGYRLARSPSEVPATTVISLAPTTTGTRALQEPSGPRRRVRATPRLPPEVPVRRGRRDGSLHLRLDHAGDPGG